MEIRYSKNFIKKMQAIDKRYKQNILTAIDGLLDNPPIGDIKPLKGKDINDFRLRVGKYRILYKKENDLIYIEDIGSRGDIYK